MVEFSNVFIPSSCFMNLSHVAGADSGDGIAESLEILGTKYVLENNYIT